MPDDYWGSRGVPDPPPGLTKGQRRRWRHQFLEKLKKGEVAAAAVPSSSAAKTTNGSSSAANYENALSSSQQHGQSALSPALSQPAGNSKSQRTTAQQITTTPRKQQKVQSGRVVKNAQTSKSNGSSIGGPRSLAHLQALRAAQLKAASTTRLCRPPLKQWMNADGTPYEGVSSVAEESEVDGGAESEVPTASAHGRWQGGIGGLALKKHPSGSSSHSSLQHSTTTLLPATSTRNAQTRSRVIYPPAGERRLSSIPDRPFIDPKASLQHLRDIQEGKDDDGSSEDDSSDSDDELPVKPAARGSIAECFAERIRGNSPVPSPGDQLRSTLHDNIVASQNRSVVAGEEVASVSDNDLPTVGNPITLAEKLPNVANVKPAAEQRESGRGKLRLNDVTEQYPEEVIHPASSSPSHPAVASSVLDYDEPMDFVYNAVEDVTYNILTTTRALPSSKPPSERNLQQDPVLTSKPRNPVFNLGTTAIESNEREEVTGKSGLQQKIEGVSHVRKQPAVVGDEEDYGDDNIVVKSQDRHGRKKEEQAVELEEPSAREVARDRIEEDGDLRSSPPTQGSAVHKSVQKYFTGPSRRAVGAQVNSSQNTGASPSNSTAEKVERLFPPAETTSPEVISPVAIDDTTPAKKRKMTGMTSKHFSTSKRVKRKTAREAPEVVAPEVVAPEESPEVYQSVADLVEARNYPNRRTRSTRRAPSPLKQIVEIGEAGSVDDVYDERHVGVASEVNDEDENIVVVASQPVSIPAAVASRKRATRKSTAGTAVSEAASKIPDLDINRQEQASSATIPEEAIEATPATPKKTPITRKKLKSTGAVSPHFITDRVDLYNTTLGGKRVPAGTSVVPVPPISESAFGIIQEKLWHDPFWLLIAVTFLNKTTGRAAVPIFWKLKKLYPTPTELAAADQNELMLMIHSLGLQNARSKRLIKMAQAWLDSPPVAGKRYRTLNYPNKGDGKASHTANVVEEDADDCGGALEIGHIPGCKDYAWDSWRIFCRDTLRGVAEDYNGKGATAEDFLPEWKSVLPGDKELRACLRWMWLREGWIWNHETGDKRRATDEEMEQVRQGQMQFDDPQEMKFAAQAAGVEVSPIKPEDKAGELDAPFEEADDADKLKEATPTKSPILPVSDVDTPKVDSVDGNELSRWPTGSSSTSSLTVMSEDNIIVAPAKTTVEVIPSKRTRGTPTLENQKLIRSERAKAKRRAKEAQIAALEDDKAHSAGGKVVEEETQRGQPTGEQNEMVVEKKATRSSSRKQKSLSETSTPSAPQKRARSGSVTAKENAKLLAEAAEFVHGPKGARRRSARVSQH